MASTDLTTLMAEAKPLPAGKGDGANSGTAGDRLGWVSPEYRVSRRVSLDAGKLYDNRCIAYAGEVPQAEAYRLLRTRIVQKSGGTCGGTLMITSAIPCEGKTLTSVNLALTFARQFHNTVLLVDCDLKRQRVQEVLGYQADRGVADYLTEGAALSELIVWPGIEKLTVISGGKVLGESSELLGSLAMKGLVHELKSRYPDRMVIFDLPPVLTGADALSFAPLVDHIVLVVRARHTSGRDVREAMELLPREKVLGVVLNRSGSAGDLKYGASRWYGKGR